MKNTMKKKFKVKICRIKGCKNVITLSGSKRCHSCVLKGIHK